MDWKLFSQLAVTVFVAVIAAWIAHRLASERDARNERRKMRIQYLLDAYRLLERSTAQDPGVEQWKAYEKAAVDIQLLGNKEQVHLAQDWVKEFSTKNRASLDPLLASLRRSLREELGLELVDDGVQYLRIKPLSSGL